MIRRKLLRVLTISFSVALLGCEKKSTPAPKTPASAPAPAASSAIDAPLRIHWLGSRKIAADTNAAGLMKIWHTPETARLTAQTLDKLSTAPWRFLLGQTNQPTTNSLRPLLDDMVAQECYLETRRASNSPSAPDEIVLAVRLDAERASLWQTNLAAIVQSLTGQTPQPRPSGGWFVKKGDRPNLIEFVRSGEWAVVAAAQDHNSLLDEMLGRIQRVSTPVISSSTNDWIEGNIDLSRFASGTNSNPALTLPKVSFAMRGDVTNVITTGELTFPDSEPLKFEDWNMPTNLFRGELASFTAIRGLKSWLGASKFWTRLQAGSAPDQLYVWSLQGFPMETFFAIPSNDASNVVDRVSELALKKEATPRLNTALAGFERSKTFNGLSWRGFPYIAPFLESLETNDEKLVFGGFIQVDLPPSSPLTELAEYIHSQTNLVYYDREMTGLRIEQWLHLGQAIRYVSGTAQLTAESASIAWLRAMAGSTTNCGTEITLISPTRLSFVRRSDAGFSAFEMHLLADWLESPDFPRGTYSLLVPSPEPPITP